MKYVLEVKRSWGEWMNAEETTLYAPRCKELFALAEAAVERPRLFRLVKVIKPNGKGKAEKRRVLSDAETLRLWEGLRQQQRAAWRALNDVMLTDDLLR